VTVAMMDIAGDSVIIKLTTPKKINRDNVFCPTSFLGLPVELAQLVCAYM
jgi:hypothetical protein